VAAAAAVADGRGEDRHTRSPASPRSSSLGILVPLAPSWQPCPLYLRSLALPARQPPPPHSYELKPDLMGWKRAARSSCIQLSLPRPPASPGPSTECLARKFSFSLSSFLQRCPLPLHPGSACSGHAGRIIVAGKQGDGPRSILAGDKDSFNPPGSFDRNRGACHARKWITVLNPRFKRTERID